MGLTHSSCLPVHPTVVACPVCHVTPCRCAPKPCATCPENGCCCAPDAKAVTISTIAIGTLTIVGEIASITLSGVPLYPASCVLRATSGVYSTIVPPAATVISFPAAVIPPGAATISVSFDLICPQCAAQTVLRTVTVTGAPAFSCDLLTATADPNTGTVTISTAAVPAGITISSASIIVAGIPFSLTVNPTTLTAGPSAALILVLTPLADQTVSVPVTLLVNGIPIICSVSVVVGPIV